MPLPVLLQDVVDAIDLPNNDWRSYLNVKTGAIITVTDEDRVLVESREACEVVPAWQREALPKVREALESDRLLELPGSFDVHEWSIMEEFARGRTAAQHHDELLDALQGRGAFRMFRSAIRRLGIEHDWYRFRESALKEIAKDWLEAHGVPYR